MATKVLNLKESLEWRQKLSDRVDAQPLVFSEAKDATSPFALEVTNGQGAAGKTLVIHIFKRGDVHPDRAVEIVQHALTDVFGRDAAKQAECDYRNVKELKKRFGSHHVVNEVHDSLTIIFGPGPVVYTRSRDWVRDNMAAALRRWYERSLSW